MSYLQLEGISKIYNETSVLDQVDLQVEKGELVTLLGPSGCGKSTLLRCIAGFTEMESGTIRLDQRDVTGVPPRSREVGMVFQSYALFPNLNVLDNIGYGLRMRGVPRKERYSRVRELLALIDMTDKEQAYPQELSGGQQQRVALARSLAVQPKLMLLDEPLSALDAKIRKSLRMEIRQIQKRLMMSMIFVTHDQEEALMISDRICVMNRGRIVQQGSPEDIYTRPRTEFIARFIGNYNVFGREETLRVLRRLPVLPDTGNREADSGAGDSYAIRPEAIRIMARGAGDANPIPGTYDETAAGLAGHGAGEGDGFTMLDGTVWSVTVLGNVLRYQVETDGMVWTVDALNEGKPSWVGEQTEVHMLIRHSDMIPLAKESA